MLKYALDNNCPEIVQDYALRCLSIHKFDSKETIDQIVQILKSSENEEIRSGLYYLLSNSDYLDEYTDVFLYGVNLVLDRDVLSSSEFTYLLKGLNETKSTESIKKILTFFTNNIEYLDRLYHQDEIPFLNNSTNAYLDDSSIFDLYLELFKVFSQKHRYLDRNEYILNFFEDTDTRLDAFKKLYSNRSEEKHPFIFLANLADLSCLELIIEEHKEDKITEDEMWNFKHLLNFTNKEMSILFNNLTNENFGNRFIPPQEVNNDEKRNVPKDVDLLFNKKLFTEEIERVFEIGAKKELKAIELSNLCVNSNYYYLSELVIHKLIKIANKEAVSLKKALNYIDNYWDFFRFNEIYGKLIRNEEIKLSAKQKKIIAEWCVSQFSNVDFKQSITKTDQKESANPTAIILWFFYRKFNIHYPKSVLLDMISFDWHEGRSDQVGIEYLEMQLDIEDMKKRVLENLDEGIEYDSILSNHIVFCKKHNIQDILKHCLDTIVDKNRYYTTRKLALDTICEMSDTYLELEEILPKIQDEFKWTVVRELMDKNVIFCESYFVNIIDNGNENDQLEAAGYLMELQNVKGLEFYVDWMKEHNKYQYYGLSLKTLDNTASIPYLLELLKISYLENLDQDHFYSLHIDVLEAFSNVALHSEDNFIKVKKCIEKFIEDNSTEIKNVNFLYSNLENLEFKFYMGKNENINLDIVIEKLKENGIY